MLQEIMPTLMVSEVNIYFTVSYSTLSLIIAQTPLLQFVRDLLYNKSTSPQTTFIGGAAVQRQTRDRKVAGSTPGRGTIKSIRSTQPSIPPG